MHFLHLRCTSTGPSQLRCRHLHMDVLATTMLTPSLTGVWRLTHAVRRHDLSQLDSWGSVRHHQLGPQARHACDQDRGLGNTRQHEVLAGEAFMVCDLYSSSVRMCVQVANSWGASWNGDGYFKIKRGTNFCQIEQNVCFGSPDTNTPVEQTRQPVSRLRYASQTKNLFSTHPEMMPGAWREQSNVKSSALVAAAAHHVRSAAAQHTRRSLSLSADPAAYAIVEAHTQARQWCPSCAILLAEH